MSQPKVVDVDLYEEEPALIDELEEDPDNIRLEHNPETMDGLTRALEHAGRYDVAPRVWRTPEGKLRALAGSGRVTAAKHARKANRDLTEIPVIQVAPPASRRDKVLFQFAENALRDPLGPVDLGRGFKMLNAEGLTYDQILNELKERGILPRRRTKAWISQMIQLTELDANVQRMVNRGELGVWHALQLHAVPADQQLAVASRIVAEGKARTISGHEGVSGDLSAAGGPAEAMLQETRNFVTEKVAEISRRRRAARSKSQPEQRNGAVVARWALAPAAIPGGSAASAGALEKLPWFRTTATFEDRQLALEAVGGGHAPKQAVDLVLRAHKEEIAASPDLRELLVTLGSLKQQAGRAKGAASPALLEFARLRARAIADLLG